MKRYKSLACAIGCCFLIAGFPRTAGAQTSAASFGELGGALLSGKTVYVTDDAGRRIMGKVTDLSGGSLKLLVDGKEASVPEARVRQITERRRNTGSYSVRGLAIGAGVGFVAGLASPQCFGCPSPGEALAASMIGNAGLGAGIGALIGLATTHERLVYRATPQAPATTFAISPLASTHGLGLRASMQF